MFTQVLRQNFQRNLISDYLIYADIVYEPWQIEDAFRILPHTCFSSHALRATSLPGTVGNSTVAIAFVRDPVNHAISGYFDLRSRVAGPQHPTTRVGLSELTDLWEKSGFEREYAYTFSQLQWLYPNTEEPIRKMSAHHGLGRLLLFPTSRMNDCLLYLENLYPDQFTDCSYASRQNVSKKDQELTPETLTKINQLPWMKLDRELYDFACQNFDASLQQLFPDEVNLSAAREDFAQRCLARRELKPQQQRKQPLVKRLRSAARIIIKGQ